MLHKHTLWSTYLGDDEYGHARFETKRSDPGEALFRLKYRDDWNQIEPLATQLKVTLMPLFDEVDLIVPLPASVWRVKQPVTELANALSHMTNIPVSTTMIVKTAAPGGSPALKNL